MTSGRIYGVLYMQGCYQSQITICGNLQCNILEIWFDMRKKTISPKKQSDSRVFLNFANILEFSVHNIWLKNREFCYCSYYAKKNPSWHSQVCIVDSLQVYSSVLP